METLDSISLRILGALLEKETTTPDQYPLTLNGLVNACNQKSSRNPVMNLTNADIGPRLSELEQEDWLKREYGSRAEKYSHRVNAKLDLTRNKLAIMTVLMLRGPQTLGEIRTNSSRLADFDSLDAVAYYVNQLIERDEPLVELMPRQPGESADRYQQLLCPIKQMPRPAPAVVTPTPTSELSMLEQRFRSLEQRIEALEKLVGDDDNFV